MSKYQLVIFDWEGTLGDPVGVLLRHLREVVGLLGLPEFDEEEARSLIHKDFYLMLSTLYGDLGSHQILALKAKFRQYHLRADNDAMLFPGAYDMLSHLVENKKLLAIATSKSQSSLDSAIESTGVSSFFFATRTPQQCACKPAPDMLEELIALAGVDKSQAVMVGDSICDIQAANNAGIASIGINVSEHAPVKALISEGARAVIDDYQSLGNYLL